MAKATRGIISFGAYVPYRRLDRSDVAAFLGRGGGRGTRSVASYDEDTTTMAVEACRLALRSGVGDGGPAAVDALWFATADPAYLEKTNATAIHAALRLDPTVAALDFGGAVRSGIGSLRTALQGAGPTLVAAADIRVGLPTSADEAAGGDGAAAFVVGSEPDGPVVAELVAAASATEEFVDRWRRPGEAAARQWEERFGETRYGPLVTQAWKQALGQAGLEPSEVDVAVVVGTHGRAVRRAGSLLGVDRLADDLSAGVGNTGTAHAGLVLAAELERAAPGQVIAVVVLADGVEVLVLRTTEALARYRPARRVADQIAAGGPLGYATFLQWRDMITVQPPNRPEPDRPSSSVAARTQDWKFGFVGSRGTESGTLHLPPARVSIRPEDEVDAMDAAPMADVQATVVTFTIDRLVYSVSPPVVFAVVDFDGGGRLPVELTDVDPESVRIGQRVEMTFRRLYEADGISNYFWKARPLRAAAPSVADEAG
ncbi:OB-fold domain-containing protein [Candidatus Poriferisocius sp.]|uniref:OB-fold domain-containing protein n=1 Tax=Candidatus Poriferisocius sp. TaxID=3101276 RepID=UPI003B5CD1F0